MNLEDNSLVSILRSNTFESILLFVQLWRKISDIPITASDVQAMAAINHIVLTDAQIQTCTQFDTAS